MLLLSQVMHLVNLYLVQLHRGSSHSEACTEDLAKKLAEDLAEIM